MPGNDQPKKIPESPIPSPLLPEEKPYDIPEEQPEIKPEEEPDIIPDEDPFETPPYEVPPPGEGP